MDLIEQHRRDTLELGAPGRPLAAGKLETVLPLDDPVALEAANPFSPEGRVRLDPRKIRAREDATVKSLLEGGAVAVLVLGEPRQRKARDRHVF